MDEQTIRERADEYVAEMIRQRLVAVEAGRKASGLRTVVKGLTEMFPEIAESYVHLLQWDVDEAEEKPKDDSPKGPEAVRRILQERTGYPWLVSELVDEMRERGWLPDSDNPANTIRAALERLNAAIEETDVVKGRDHKGRVTYMYDPDRSNLYEEEPF